MVAAFVNEPIDRDEQIPMPAVRPSTTLTDVLDREGCGAPALFGGLADVASLKLQVSLLEELKTSFLVSLGGH